jgi:starvation-inducible DNA-binding protein
MNPTKNSLPEKVRIQISLLLQKSLVDTIDLTLQAKQAHWNVKGPSFIALHELFDKVAEDTESYMDLIAERIVQLGGVAVGTLDGIGKKSNLPVYPLTITDGKEHAALLAHALASYGESIREAITQTGEMEDIGTEDLLIEVLRGVDKLLWLVEAHTQTNHA